VLFGEEELPITKTESFIKSGRERRKRISERIKCNYASRIDKIKKFEQDGSTRLLLLFVLLK